jgi:hypothetical protein
MNRLLPLVLQDIRRNRGHFALASIGIVVGISAFAFFLALGAGVRNVVLGDIFPLDKLEVVPKSLDIDMGPVRMSTGPDILDDAAIAKLRGVEGVVEVYPKMRLTVPALGKGGKGLLGNDVYVEMIGDGIDPVLVEKDVRRGFTFARTPPADPPKPCAKHDECGKQAWCAADEETGDKACRDLVPVLASNHLVEIYNGAFRRTHNFPKLNPDFVVGLTFDLEIGDSMVGASRRDKTRKEKAILVGFSNKAITLGITMPIDYVKHFNSTWGRPEDASRYHSAIVQVASKDEVAMVAKAIDEAGFTVVDTGAEQAGFLIVTFTAVLALVSLVIVGIAAINIMHVFFMLVYERQHELGIMRAVGATRTDVRRIILGESALVGLVAGSLGVGLALVAGQLVDAVSDRYIPDFPYKPETYFDFGPAILLGALGFAIAFCTVGAWLPALRASRLDPARVLTQP